MRQFFITDSLQLNDSVEFDRDQSHHVRDVLRMKNGDLVRLVDRENRVFLAELSFEGSSVFAQVKQECEAEDNGNIICVRALIKKEKWELMIQKACELGASVIVPLVTKRTIIRLDDKEINKKLDRWNKIALEACQQSNRSTVCRVERPIVLSEIDKYRQEVSLVAYENEENRRLRETLTSDEITFVVGPEGGFAPEEVDILNKKGFTSVSLGSRILRAETAVMFVLSVIEGLKQ